MRHGNEVSAQAGSLRAATEHVREARTDITALSQTLSGQIESIGSDWGGEGAAAFRRVHVAWQEKQARIVRALDDFAASLTDTDRDNLATDTEQAEVAGRLLSRLG